MCINFNLTVTETYSCMHALLSESCSVMSNSLWPHGLYSPWNSTGQSTPSQKISFLQGIFPTQVSHIAGGSFTSWATREAQEYWNGWPIPSPGDLPDPGFEPGSPAWQADSRWATRETPWSQHIRYPAYIPENQNIWKAHKTEKLPGMARRNQFLRRESCTFNPFFGGSQKSRTLL